MKYDLDLEGPDANTSHAVVADLVGTGKRVLDVGCSTGYLAKLLQERGNVVVGIEIDAEAASKAEPWTERVVVADLEDTELGDAFAGDAFDVIVFADVLEHLTDPLRVLRHSTSLLRSDGFVVLSIPNVAHGAVRLALLEGRFEYTGLGLLDDTHVRFFTRSTLEDFLRSAGFVATDYRRTTAAVFATEIPLQRNRFPEDVVDQVEDDPDSTTYQFVVRAVPDDGTEATRALAARLVATDQQLHASVAQLDEIVRAASDPRRRPRTGLLIRVGKGIDPLEAVRETVVDAELRRRLPGYEVRYYAIDSSESSTTWSGEPVHPLLPWSLSRAREVAEAVDAVVATDLNPPPELIDDLAESGCPAFLGGAQPDPSTGEVHSLAWAAAAGPPREQVGRDLPDILCLAGRLHSAQVLERRLEYLRLLKKVPPAGGGYVAIALRAQPDTVAASIARSLDEIATRTSAELIVVTACDSGVPVFVEHLQSSHTLIEADDPLDLLALVAASKVVITDTAGVMATCIGMRHPVQALAGSDGSELSMLAEWISDPDSVADRPSELPAALDLAPRRASDARSVARLIDSVDLAFDDLAAAVRGSTGRRAMTSIPLRIRELIERVSVLETALAALQHRMAEERSQFGSQAVALQLGPKAEARVDEDTSRRIMSIEKNLRELESQRGALEDELTAVYATKTMRVLKPARDAYWRFRSSRR